ncbi:MAG: hypothetical protein KF861_22240, partial [Planctomycetaceae bacterium]|nr:hypothetical protein [Planctomycetaceae bacterium]
MSDSASAIESSQNVTPPTTCSLPLHLQNRNLLLFAGCTGLQYFAAPVLYVGVTQASLCDRLGADARTSNLPATMYFAMTAMPALIAWARPAAASLKPNLIICYSVTATMLAVMAWAMVAQVSNEVRLALVILQGAVAGSAMPAAIAFLWEAIGRGFEESRRGLALSLAFGAGPLLAVAGSFGSQVLLSGELLGRKIEWLQYPWNFAVLFAAGVPCLLLGAFLGSRFVIPLPLQDAVREPFSKVADLCGGMLLGLLALGFYLQDMRLAGHALLVVAGILFVRHFWDILSQRQLLLATIVTVLLYSGNTIPSNMNLYTSEVLGDLP